MDNDSVLYPLAFYPVYKDKIWGGDRINRLLHKDFSPLKNCGEMWLLSDVDGEASVVSQGNLADNDINELLNVFFDDLVGECIFNPDDIHFPLLFKILDAEQWLSVQVHPNDDIAHEMGLKNGKTEMWHVLHAQPEAKIALGFNKEISKDEIKARLEDDTIEAVLNYVNVKQGDTIFIPAGTVHSLGPGIMVAEIQQSSDTTFRMYDWNRKDANGKTRRLDIDKALQAIDVKAKPIVKHVTPTEFNNRYELVDCEKFTTNLIKIKDAVEFTFDTEGTFIVVISIEGKGTVVANNVTTTIDVGECVLIPAVIDKYEIVADEGSMSVLEVYA